MKDFLGKEVNIGDEVVDSDMLIDDLKKYMKE